MKISLETARLAIGRIQFNKLPNRERLLRTINPMASRNTDTPYLRELALNGIKNEKPIFRHIKK